MIIQQWVYERFLETQPEPAPALSKAKTNRPKSAKKGTRGK